MKHVIIIILIVITICSCQKPPVQTSMQYRPALSNDTEDTTLIPGVTYFNITYVKWTSEFLASTIIYTMKVTGDGGTWQIDRPMSEGLLTEQQVYNLIK